MVGGKGYRRQNKAAHIERKRPKSSRNYTAGNGFERFCVSGANRQISSAKRRWTLCPVCRNTSRENGRSFLMSVAGRNTTSFAGNAKGTSSRASVPPLSNRERRSAAPHRDQKSINPPTQITGAFKLLDKASVPRGTGAIICLREALSAIDSSTYIVPVWMI